MNDAESCGFIFRIVGERNYWSLMIDKKVLKLAHVKDGELIILKDDGWLQSDNWIIHNEEAIIEYTAKDSCREPNHPFPFGWLDNRTLSIFFCKKIKIIIFIFLLEFKELKIKNDQWYVLFVQEILKDIKIKAGIYGDLSVEYLRKSDDETDYNENKQGAVGLIANKGRCKFRNIVIYI
ncbi:hypothetical protein PFFCH_05089 [Plasmodium falciparum FCH/4]|uniref:Uncharacterized protein n=1 Tax=Plasmodium falciparum FCH/4 TaxID=1036724 RepID=A0A024VG62_PLAFA|nr:hypothetical protein PFFCH_05089 [Plasmodium falciparum FCH/4]